MTEQRDITPMQRTRGEARVGFVARDGRAHLADLRQAGSAKVILPRSYDAPEVVFLNTSGGLTGGDRLAYSASIGAGLHVTATTQTAERAYRASSGVARVTVGFDMAEGAFLDWLPQETILFDRSALDRRTEVRLAKGAGCLCLETIVLGRAAMGETVTALHLREHRQITRGGVPVWVEPFAIDTKALASGAAGLAGGRAFASLVLVAPWAADVLEPLRRILATAPEVAAAASAFSGKLTLRARAPDAFPLRRLIARALPILRQNRALPRVWQA